MIYYSEKKLDKIGNNIFEIPVEKDDGSLSGFIYVSRVVYDDAVTLYDRFEGDFEAVASKIAKDVKIPDSLTDVLDLMPSPIDILVPYVLLCKDGMPNITLESVCGALTVMSRSISFRNFIVIPEAVRAGVSFTRFALSSYKDIWNMMFERITVYSIEEHTKNLIVDLATEILSRTPQTVIQQQQYEQPQQSVSNISMFEDVGNASRAPELTKDEISMLTKPYSEIEDVRTPNDDEVDFASVFNDLFDEYEESNQSIEDSSASVKPTAVTNTIVEEAEKKLNLDDPQDKGLFDVIQFYSRKGGK